MLNIDEYLQVHMTDIGNSKADTSKEMQVIDGTPKLASSWLLHFKSERVKSFKDWPEDVKHRPELLAESGFLHHSEYGYYICNVCLAAIILLCYENCQLHLLRSRSSKCQVICNHYGPGVYAAYLHGRVFIKLLQTLVASSLVEQGGGYPTLSNSPFLCER